MEGVRSLLASHESRATSYKCESRVTDHRRELSTYIGQRKQRRPARVLYVYSLLLETIVNSNQDKGVGKQVKGTIKHVVGKVTGDKVLEGEGKIEKGIGKVQ